MYRAFVDLYRVFCQPTAFLAETGRLRPWRRFVALLRTAPAMLAAQMVLAGAVALCARSLGSEAQWWPGGLGYAFEGLLAGLCWALFWSLPFGVAWGTVWGVSAWVVQQVLVPALHVPHGDAVGTWVPIAFASGVSLGLVSRSVTGLFWGMAAALGLGAVWLPEWRLPLMGLLLASFVVGYFQAGWYPIDAIATLAQLSTARRRPKHARAFFQGSPIYWREPIWLTLPGLKSFLLLVGEQDFQAGLEECLFVISSRPTQARPARLALLHIVADHLAGLSSIPAIAAAGDLLGRTTSQDIALPGPLEDAFPALIQLAQHAAQHLTAILPHNRQRALERLRDEADDLGRRLALAPDPMSSALVTVASQWRQVAQRLLADMGQAETDAGYVHNPYVFGQPIEETETNLFVGRRDTVREIEVSLLGAEQKPALVLWGPRRMGKTSVLLQLPRLLGPEFVPAFVDMQAAQVRESIGSFLRSLTGAAAHALRRRGVAAGGLSEAEVESSPFMAFATWMEGVESALTGDQHLLLCLDEFERLDQSIREGKLPAALLDEFRHIIQHHARVVVLLAGSHRPDELELNWADALISAKMIRVSYLSEEEARLLVTQPVPDFEIGYQPESVDRVLAITRCQPYLVQALCYELVNYLNLECRREATPEDVEAALARALESAHLYFAEMWRQFTPPQQALLTHLALRPEGATLEELATAGNLAPEGARRELDRLQSRTTLEHLAANGRWRYQVPMVAAWVRAQDRG